MGDLIAYLTNPEARRMTLHNLMTGGIVLAWVVLLAFGRMEAEEAVRPFALVALGSVVGREKNA